MASRSCHDSKVFIYIFIFTLLQSEDRAGKVWEPSNKVMFFLLSPHPPPQIYKSISSYSLTLHCPYCIKC